VELKARFDEAQNIEWARQLEQAGIHVICGIKGLKTHAKATLVVRREAGGITRYMHFGTGNYNEQTALIYCDISFMTASPDYGRDASLFFNTITGYSATQNLLKLSVAPTALRDKLLDMIDNEIERKKHGQKALIIAKMNSLVDRPLIEKFYQASRAGVSIMLNIRGICCLRPGIKDLSENIRVVSTIGRFLEHARAYYFLHGGEEKCFISSADGMTRNLDRRIELLVPIEDPDCKSKLKFLLDTHFQDISAAYGLKSNGSYFRQVSKSKKVKGSQEALMAYFRKKKEIAQQAKKTAFEPHVLSSDPPK
jgi:polyphosphate kinase